MEQKLLNYLPTSIKKIVNNTADWLDDQLLEIRMRVNQPLQIITYHNDYFLTSKGQKAKTKETGLNDELYIVTKEDIEKAMLILTDNSIYALERQLKEGFITIQGGHRVGFTGRVVLENGEIKSIRNINSLNYRITREIIGVGNKVVTKIYNDKSAYYYNTLIISPPLCGKTTLLRDLIRLISMGISELEIKGKKIGVVDERSELAGAYNGIPQNKIGIRTDLLDNCPKAAGMLLLIRAMSPDIIAVDEIGRKEDIRAIEEAVNSGVNLITTVHGRDLNSLKARADFQRLLNYFQRFIILSKRKGIGTIDKVINNMGERVD